MKEPLPITERFPAALRVAGDETIFVGKTETAKSPPLSGPYELRCRFASPVVVEVLRGTEKEPKKLVYEGQDFQQLLHFRDESVQIVVTGDAEGIAELIDCLTKEGA